MISYWHDIVTQGQLPTVLVQERCSSAAALPHAQHDSSSSAAHKGTAGLKKTKKKPQVRTKHTPASAASGSPRYRLGCIEEPGSDSFSLENNLEMSNVCKKKS